MQYQMELNLIQQVNLEFIRNQVPKRLKCLGMKVVVHRQVIKKLH